VNCRLRHSITSPFTKGTVVGFFQCFHRRISLDTRCLVTPNFPRLHLGRDRRPLQNFARAHVRLGLLVAAAPSQLNIPAFLAQTVSVPLLTPYFSAISRTGFVGSFTYSSRARER
jgi:hypothetical protein